MTWQAKQHQTADDVDLLFIGFELSVLQMIDAGHMVSL